MKTVDVIRRAGKNLRQAKARTILTSLAIGVGAFTIALAMAAGNGGRAYLDDMVSTLGSMRNINVSAKMDAPQEDTGPKKIDAEEVEESNVWYKELTPENRRAIEQLDGVERVLPTIGVDVFSVAANGSDKYEGYVAVQSDDSAMELVAGSLGDDYAISAGTIVLPQAYLESFGFESAEAALGETVVTEFKTADGDVFTRNFKIAAVEGTPSSPLAYYNDQFRIANTDGEEIAEKQRPADAPEGYYGFMVTAEEGANVDEVKAAILAVGDFDAQTFAEMRTSVMEVVNIVQYGLMGFGGLAIVASIFGIINTQYISVLERTQQIGLMKALGARSKDVGRLFRYEAALIGFLGGVIGVGLAFLVTLLNPVIADVLSLEEGTRLLRMDWIMSIVLIVGLMAVAIVSGWFPSRKAAKLDPIEALRTE